MTFKKKGAAGITLRKVIYAMSVSLEASSKPRMAALQLMR
jgi:hypothetical protein